MTRESKIGVAMVLLILGVVGFFAYKRFTRSQDSVVETEPQSTDETDANDDEFPPLRQPDEPEILPVVATNSRQIPDEEPEAVDDPFGESAAFPPARSTASTTPRLPTEVPDDRSDFAEDRTEEFVVEGDASADEGMTFEPTETGGASSDPFGGDTTAAAEPAGNEYATEPEMVFEEESAAQTETAESDPFLDEPETVARGEAAGIRELEPSNSSIAAPELLDESETVSVQRGLRCRSRNSISKRPRKSLKSWKGLWSRSATRRRHRD